MRPLAEPRSKDIRSRRVSPTTEVDHFYLEDYPYRVGVAPTWHDADCRLRDAPLKSQLVLV